MGQEGGTYKNAVVSDVQCLFSNTVGQRGETYSISKRNNHRHDKAATDGVTHIENARRAASTTVL